jgi:hypothetical protein
MSGNDREATTVAATAAADPAADGVGPAASAAPGEDAPAARRAALAEIARLAALAPALAVLFDPEAARAY